MTQAISDRPSVASAIGTPTAPAKTWLDAVELADLDWTVAKQPLYYGDKRRAYPGTKVAIVREDTNDAMGITGPNYGIIQNADAFTFLDPMIEQGASILSAGLNGSTVFAEVELADAFEIPGIVINNGKAVGDLFSPRLIVRTTHDGTRAMTANLSVLRLICKNGLTTTDAVAGFSIRHSGDIESKLDEAHRILDASVRFKDEFALMATKLAATKLPAKFVEQFPVVLFPNRKGEDEKIAAQTQARRDALVAVLKNGTGLAGWSDSGWGLYNAVAEYADHVVDYKATKKASAEANRFRHLMDGPGAALKNRALSLIMSAS